MRCSLLGILQALESHLQSFYYKHKSKSKLKYVDNLQLILSFSSVCFRREILSLKREIVNLFLKLHRAMLKADFGGPLHHDGYLLSDEGSFYIDCLSP